MEMYTLVCKDSRTNVHDLTPHKGIFTQTLGV